MRFESSSKSGSTQVGGIAGRGLVVLAAALILAAPLKGAPPAGHQGAGQPVSYHAPCHLCRGLEVTAEPRTLLQIAGTDYLPAADEEVCCGFSGSYSVDFPEMSALLLERKLDNLTATGAELFVTDCPGCIMQLRGGLERKGATQRVMHMAELLWESSKKDELHPAAREECTRPIPKKPPQTSTSSSGSLGRN